MGPHHSHPYYYNSYGSYGSCGRRCGNNCGCNACCNTYVTPCNTCVPAPCATYTSYVDNACCAPQPCGTYNAGCGPVVGGCGAYYGTSTCCN